MPYGPKPKSPAERFWTKIKPVGECWEWAAAIGKDGYGRFGASRNVTCLAHRWAYEALRADVPDGLTLDHLCRNRRCVNPWHLEPVTLAVNAGRGGNSLKECCPEGHEFAAENTYCRPGGRERQCCICRKEQRRRFKELTGR